MAQRFVRFRTVETICSASQPFVFTRANLYAALHRFTSGEKAKKKLGCDSIFVYYKFCPRFVGGHRSFTSRIEFRFLGDFRFQSFPFLGGLRFRGVFGLRSSDIGLVTMFRRRVDQKEFSLPELLILTVTQSTQSE